MKKLHRPLLGVLIVTVALLPAFGANVSVAQAATWTPLTLENGWTTTFLPSSNAAVTNISGIVHFKGAIATSGTNAQAFTLPAGFRPATTVVLVPVDLCNATKGRLFIFPGGVVMVRAEKAFSDAQCFTSLDGASFALAPGS